MKSILNLSIMFLPMILLLVGCKPHEPKKYSSIAEYPIYTDNDLGANYSPEKTVFKLWAPTAAEVKLRIYDAGNGGNATAEHDMEYDANGVWVYKLSGDWKNKYYTYQVKMDTAWKTETVDIYAKGVGVNGDRGMVVDFAETNPEGWDKDKKPDLKKYNDIILYEIHARDLSMSENSGIKNKGKFLGFTEKGTTNKEGEKTGLDHIVDLGVTHVHILPAFDFYSVDETKLEDNIYNWGYDPKNYNVPEGSYSTNPNDGRVRIKEFKQMVKTLHDNGLRVVMDVVYNHTRLTEKSNFEQLVPGYYYRMRQDGKFSDASACGNETASDHPMMRKFITESLLHWIKEYHVDGFRFDLMGIHDIETMNYIRAEIDKIDSTIFLYGEGWNAGDSPLPYEKRALKQSAMHLHRVAVFSDDIRDGIKGHWSHVTEKGFISGNGSQRESVKFGIVASTSHDQVNCSLVNNSKAPYSSEPYQTITYVTCHDNPCLWDKLKLSNPSESDAELIRLQKLANAIVLTSQGVPFLHAGEEFVRTKFLHENTYNLPDSINQLDWSRKTKYKDVYTYYKSMVQLRKNHPAFRMPSTEMIQKHLRFYDTHDSLLISYMISDNANGDKWKKILVYISAYKNDHPVALPEGNWVAVATGYEVNETGIKSGPLSRVLSKTVSIPSRSIFILVDQESVKK